ncbi:MAG: adenosine deaminase [Ilumatobacter sp.]|uniref:adenosine deaminase n=1 Tax=Ilumatobacter sp. TaxID=1967498 RepID=UPI00261623B8|nr:adenosine deaminase [Ilumatobacter sp.]MDJ0767624.1 adenosine deaminase [Ilumatobacter sp.]
MSSLDHFVRGLPKAELHVHIEGTLEPELMFELAERNGVRLPYSSVDDVRAAYSFTDLQSFLDIYYAGASVLCEQQDFDDLMTAYLHRAHADGVRRAEIMFDPQTHLERGVDFDAFMPGFLGAIERAEAELGISCGLIMSFLRHMPVESAIETFAESAPYHDVLLAVGLDSSEIDHPPADFLPVFELARRHQLHTVAHAGEEGPPEYVWAALDVLRVERIDHGVKAEPDAELVARLATDQMPLTMCPLSNVALGGFARLEDHNLKRMMDRGVKVTINSDDPAYFGGYVGDNYVQTAEALGLTRDDLVTLAANSIEASFAPDEAKAAWLDELRTVPVV